MRILAIGDIVGIIGVDYAAKNIRKIKSAEKADLVIANAENSSPTNGLDVKSANLLLDSGADVLTGGNHTLRRHEIHPFLEENKCVLRPHNLPDCCPGNGYVILRSVRGMRVLVMSLLGQTYMDLSDNPFTCAERILNKEKNNYDICLADFHAEATSEKAAFARYFDGMIHIIYGTHTHVQTADEQLLDKGSGFITDIGMCGVLNSILGVKPEPVIKHFVTRIHDRFEPAEGQAALCGAVFEVDEKNFVVTSVKRIKY